MTDLTTPTTPTVGDPDAFEPSGHPVRRAVVALAVFPALVIGLWWSGLAAPRVTVAGHSAMYDEATQRGRSTVFIENDGPFRIKVVGVRALEGDHDFRLVQQIGIASGEQAEATVEATIDCEQTIADEAIPFELVIESAIGIELRFSDPFTVSIPVFNCSAPG